MATGRVAIIKNMVTQDQLAVAISAMWQEMDTLRRPWVEATREVRNYVFAVDTTTTTNNKLPWKNKTTIPKLCQIRDNLHANYMATIFPNDDWLRWERDEPSKDDNEKARAIEVYMANKLRLFGFKEVISRLLYDYIDTGNFFADSEYRIDTHTDPITGESITAQGPIAIRHSPYDVTFNLTAPSFREGYHIIRYLRSIGDLELELQQNPDSDYLGAAIADLKKFRTELSGFSSADVAKGVAIQIDGFGSFERYLQSGYVEFLEFRGNIYDEERKQLLINQIITVADRRQVYRKEPMRSWLGRSSLIHGGWRYRPDNLYGQGPLDNLVGMQYRIDHMENVKADLMDLIAHPPLVIKGQVEDFDWGPFVQIVVGEDGSIETLKVDAVALTYETNIAILEQKMEEYAGAPRQSIGQRTPGEKTAFEINILEVNANKMFIEKTTSFELRMEELLNDMLEVARRSLDGEDVVKVIDTDLGVETFMKITPDDLKAKGRIRPVGARHFARRAQQIQNYIGFRTAVAADPAVMNHISGLGEAKMFEDLLGFEQHHLVVPNIRIMEQANSQRLSQTLMQQLQEESMTPADEDEAAAQQSMMQGGNDGSQRPV